MQLDALRGRLQAALQLARKCHLVHAHVAQVQLADKCAQARGRARDSRRRRSGHLARAGKRWRDGADQIRRCDACGKGGLRSQRSTHAAMT